MEQVTGIYTDEGDYTAIPANSILVDYEYFRTYKTLTNRLGLTNYDISLSINDRDYSYHIIRDLINKLKENMGSDIHRVINRTNIRIDNVTSVQDYFDRMPYDEDACELYISLYDDFNFVCMRY